MLTGPWNTLSIDIVGHLPANRRMKYLNAFVNCYSKYTILIPSKDHTAQTVSNALLDRVVPYFGVPWGLLLDRGWEFTGQVWEELLKTLGVQRVLTSLYHPEGNAINEWSRCTMNNMLGAYLYYEGTPVPRWVDKIPAIMLTLNFMPHQPHGYSASMITTGRENTLPPDLVAWANACKGVENPSAYVSGVIEKLREVHQRVAPRAAPTRQNPNQPGSLIWVSTPPLERTSKLSPKWIGPFRVLKVPNPYQVAYASGVGPQTMHIHHTKPALLDLLMQDLLLEEYPPTPPSLGYFPSSYMHCSTPQNQARGDTGATTPQHSQPPLPTGVSRLA